MPKQIMNVPNLKMVPPPAPNSVQEQQKVPTLREINEEFEFLYFNRQEEQTLLVKNFYYLTKYFNSLGKDGQLLERKSRVNLDF